MFRNLQARGAALAAGCAAALVATQGAAAPAKGARPAKAVVSTHYYRDSVDTLTAPPAIFVSEVPASAANSGIIFKVEKDAQGRIVKLFRLEDGKLDSYSTYEYEPGAKLPTRQVTFRGGVETGYRTITRDAQGRIDRYDYFTAEGAPTNYTLVTHHPGYDAYVGYDRDGSVRSRSEEYFDASNREIRSVSHGRDGVRTVETTYDPERGLETATRATDNGKLSYTERYTYDGNDDLIRQDTFDDQGRPYVYTLYEHGRWVRKHYDFSSGTKQDVEAIYDARHLLSGSRMITNGRLTCTFTIEREPNGLVKRTIATGPDGSLWAEYPKLAVSEVDQEGRPPDAPTVGVIHHAGQWYGPPQ